MIIVYALINDSGRIYVGMTTSIVRRLYEHNIGNVFSTKSYRPWRILYQEKLYTRQEARNREKYLKSGVGKEYLKAIVKPM